MLNIVQNHRVVPPTDLEKRKQHRRSVCYFAMANGGTLMHELESEDGVAVSKTNSDGQPLTIDEFMTKVLRRYFEELEVLDS